MLGLGPGSDGGSEAGSDGRIWPGSVLAGPPWFSWGHGERRRVLGAGFTEDRHRRRIQNPSAITVVATQPPTIACTPGARSGSYRTPSSSGWNPLVCGIGMGAAQVAGFSARFSACGIFRPEVPNPRRRGGAPR